MKLKNDLTQGSITKSIILYTLPLLIGNIFQQLYNTADSMIVGNFLGKGALASVGSAGPLINFLVSFFMGLASGSSVVIARYYGANKNKEVKDTIHTTLGFGIIIGVFLTIVGLIFTPILLRIMQTPEEIIEGSITYFKIFFSGISGLVLYNVCSGIYYALGFSFKPLIFLIISTLTNILLDITFVTVFNMGIAGVALATIIAQFLSSILSLIYLMKLDEKIRVDLSKIRIHKKYLLQILKIGLPGGLQNSIVSLSNLVVQTNINKFGDIAVAGCASYTKIDGFALMPSGSFSLALTNFVSQNIGAKKFDRVKKGTFIGLALSMTITELMGVFIYFFAPNLINLFNNDQAVIEYGVMMTRNIVFAYFLIAFSHGMSGVLRGLGKAKLPMFTMIICWCLIRITWLETMVPLFNDIRFVFWGYPLTWSLSAIVLIVSYLVLIKKHDLEYFSKI